MLGANDGVLFPMTDLLAALNARRALAQGPAFGDLPPAVSPASVALSPLLLAAQVVPQFAALALVCVHVLVKRLGAPMQSQQGTALFFHQGLHHVRISASLGAFNRQFAGLFSSATSKPGIAILLAADRSLVASDQTGDLRDAVLDFHKAGNLVSFNLAEVFVIHRTTSTCRPETREF